MTRRLLWLLVAPELAALALAVVVFVLLAGVATIAMLGTPDDTDTRHAVVWRMT
jgi:hypothetical protein